MLGIQASASLGIGQVHCGLIVAQAPLHEHQVLLNSHFQSPLRWLLFVLKGVSRTEENAVWDSNVRKIVKCSEIDASNNSRLQNTKKYDYSRRLALLPRISLIENRRDMDKHHRGRRSGGEERRFSSSVWGVLQSGRTRDSFAGWRNQHLRSQGLKWAAHCHHGKRLVWSNLQPELHTETAWVQRDVGLESRLLCEECENSLNTARWAALQSAGSNLSVNYKVISIKGVNIYDLLTERTLVGESQRLINAFWVIVMETAEALKLLIDEEGLLTDCALVLQ